MQERLIREVADADFGALQLWAVAGQGGSAGGPMQELELREWRGAVGRWPLVIAVEGAGDRELADLTPALRTVLKALPGREAALSGEVSARMLRLAREWAEDASLSADALTAALRITEVSVDFVDGAYAALWLKEDTGIFADHVLVANLDAAGHIEHVSLQG